MPEEYGSWHTVYNNFRKWSKEGIIAKIFENLIPDLQETDQIQIDATYIKAHQHSTGAKKMSEEDSGEAIGKSRGGLTTKIHAITDDKGHVINFVITGGNINDCTQAEDLFRSIIRKGIYILADRAYDTDKIIDYISLESAIAVIPSRRNRKTQRSYDKEI